MTATEGQGKGWRRDVRDPNSRQTRIEDWLREHPGLHRPADIAAGLDDTAYAVARAAYQMMVSGRLVRGVIPTADRDRFELRNGSRWVGYGTPGTPTGGTESVATTR